MCCVFAFVMVGCGLLWFVCVLECVVRVCFVCLCCVLFRVVVCVCRGCGGVCV